MKKLTLIFLFFFLNLGSRILHLGLGEYASYCIEKIAEKIDDREKISKKESSIYKYIKKNFIYNKICHFHSSEFTPDNIIGYDEEKKILKKIINELQHANKKYSKIIFSGPAGCGKTRFIKTIANETNLPVLAISIDEIVSVNGAIKENIEILLDIIEEFNNKSKPLMIYFDHIDYLPSLDEITTQAINNFLEKIENSQLKNIFIFAETSNKKKLNQKIFKNDRFFYVEIPLPRIIDIKKIYFFKEDNKNKSCQSNEYKELYGLSVAEILKRLEINKAEGEYEERENEDPACKFFSS